MVDVVNDADALAQLEQVADSVIEILRVEDAGIVIRAISLEALWSLRRIVDLNGELHAPDAREIVLARVEEHAVEQLGGSIDGGRITRTQLAVDLDQGVLACLDRVLPKSLGDNRAAIVALGEKDFERFNAGLDQLADQGGSQFLVGIHHHFAGRHVDDIGRNEGAFEVVGRNFRRRDTMLADFPHQACGDLAALGHNHVARRVHNRVRQLQPVQAVINIPQ